MGASRHDEGAATAAAWIRFQGRLAEAIHELEDGQWMSVDVAGVDDAPAVQAEVTFSGHVLRAELIDTTEADVRLATSELERHALLARGWRSAGDVSLYVEHPVRHADQVAVELVRALREVLGVVHPVFLEAGGLERDPEAPDHREVDTPEDGAEPDDDPLRVVLPSGRQELLCEIGEVVARVLGVTVPEVDDDEDYVLPTEHSVLYVRAARLQPSIEVFGSIVLGISRPELVERELEVLNASHAWATFTREGDRVVLRHRTCGAPFVPTQLGIVLESLVGTVDATATELATRLGGRRFLDPDPAATRPPTPLDRLHHGMRALLELMGERRLTSATVSTLFAHNRTALTNHLTALRTGRIVLDLDELAEHGRGLDDVLDHLRRGLRHAVGVEVGEARAGRSQPPSHQLSLLPELEQTLDDDGSWGATGS